MAADPQWSLLPGVLIFLSKKLPHSSFARMGHPLATASGGKNGFPSEHRLMFESEQAFGVVRRQVDEGPLLSSAAICCSVWRAMLGLGLTPSTLPSRRRRSV